MIRIAVVGDVHRHFSEFDVSYFNSSDYDTILFVGDLSAWWPHQGLEVARMLAKIDKRAFFIPGNHDTINALQLLAEVKSMKLAASLASLGQASRLSRLNKEIASVSVCGYSIHPIRLDDECIDLIAARPFSMGGADLASRRLLRQRYGVTSMDDSVRLLRKRIDKVECAKVIFLAHNGPTGLGSTGTDIWGRDFAEVGGDHGDPDLREAVNYAVERGLEVVAVIAGHMHRQIIGGGTRRWHLSEEGIHYINAAFVPRIFQREGQTIHHHVRLTFEGSVLDVEDAFIVAEE